MEVFRDASGELDLTDMMIAAARGRFEPLPTRHGANFGYLDGTVWLRFRLQVPSGSSGRLVIEIPYVHLDRIVLHVPAAPDGQRTQRAGDLIPISERDFKYRMPAFELDLPPGETVIGYLEVSSKGSVQVPALVWERSAFQTAAKQESHLLGMYYGVLIAMALYNLLVFTSLRDTNYLYYLGALASIGLFAMTMNGFGHLLVWGNFPGFSDVAFPMFIALGNFALIQFSRSFLRVRQHLPRASKILYCLQAVSGLMIAGAFLLPYRPVALFLTVLVPITTLIIFTSAILCWRRGERQARYFMLAWSVFLIGATTFALSTHGLVPSNALTRNGVQIGSAIEMILLAFALADRMLLLQRENEEIRNEATRRLMRDLHDGMGRHFVKLIRGMDNREIPRAHLKADLRQAFTDMRLLVSSTEPHFSNLVIGLVTIREQFDGILRDHGISWNWQVSLRPRDVTMCPRRTLSVLRVVQEALTNSVKYANATTITVRAFKDSDRRIVVEIEDDGTEDWDDSSTGHGFLHMQQRARDFGLDLQIGGEIRGIRIRFQAE